MGLVKGTESGPLVADQRAVYCRLGVVGLAIACAVRGAEQKGRRCLPGRRSQDPGQGFLCRPLGAELAAAESLAFGHGRLGGFALLSRHPAGQGIDQQVGADLGGLVELVAGAEKDRLLAPGRRLAGLIGQQAVHVSRIVRDLVEMQASHGVFQVQQVAEGVGDLGRAAHQEQVVGYVPGLNVGRRHPVAGQPIVGVLLAIVFQHLYDLAIADLLSAMLHQRLERFLDLWILVLVIDHPPAGLGHVRWFGAEWQAQMGLANNRP